MKLVTVDRPGLVFALTATELKGGKGYQLIRGEGEASNSAELLLYDVVGFDFWSGGGITAKKVVDDLAALAGVEQLDVRINSPGGDVFDGTAIYNALARFSGKVVVHVDGIAASIASVIAMAGEEIRVAENAMMMVHRPWSHAIGDAPDMRQMADVLDKAWTALLATYSRRTGRRASSIEQLVVDGGGEFWMTAQEAVDEGFADTVTKGEKGAQAFGLSRFARVPARLAATAAKDDTPPRRIPEVAEVAAPRISRAPRDEGRSPAARRRIFETLRRGG